MGFNDLRAFLGEPVVLPIRGREFTFPEQVSARIGLELRRLHQMATAAVAEDLDQDTPALTDAEQEALFDALLGEAKEGLLDYASGPEYEFVKATLFNIQMYGREVAERVWNSQGEAVAPSASAESRPPSRPRGSRAGSKMNARRDEASHGTKS